MLWLAWRCAQPGSGHEQGRLQSPLCPLDAQSNYFRNTTSLFVVFATWDNSHGSSSNVKKSVFFEWGSLPGLLSFVVLLWSSYFDLLSVLFPAWPSSVYPAHLSAISAVLWGRAVFSPCTLNIDPQGFVQGHQESVRQAGAESLVYAHKPELPPAIFYHATSLMKELWLPTHGDGLEAGGFNACKALYLSMAPFIPASRRVHHHHKKIIYSFISTRWLRWPLRGMIFS